MILRTPFNPGNRVTVWKDEFYCVCCSQSLGKRQSALGGTSRPTSPPSFIQERHNINGGTNKIQQHEHQTQPHRLSFADQPSPMSFAGGGGAENPGRVAHKANGSILKSSLRQSSTMQPISSPKSNGAFILNFDSFYLIM